MPSFPSPAELLPHAGRAVLIDCVIDNTETCVTATATMTAAHPYFVEGRGVPAWVGLEIMAQAIAVHACLCGGGADACAPRRGMLLGTRHYDGRVAWFAEGARLLVHAERSFGQRGGMAACDCHIENAGRILAKATIIILEEVDA